MHKLFLISILNLLITSTTFSQVLISKVSEGTIVLGPKNVDHQNEETATKYFSELGELKMILKTADELTQSNINTLEAKKRLNKKNKNLLETYKFEAAKIATEKELLNKLIGDWMARIKSNKTLLALSLLNDEVCYEITTDKGTFQNDQLEIYQADPKGSKYEAFIPISSFSTMEKKEGHWVRKKKSPNCYSQNPEDCYVACYEQKIVTHKTYEIEDMVGNISTIDVEPLGMKCTHKDKMCYFLNNRNEKKNGLNLRLKSIESGEDVEIVSWQKMDCTTN